MKILEEFSERKECTEMMHHIFVLRTIFEKQTISKMKQKTLFNESRVIRRKHLVERHLVNSLIFFKKMPNSKNYRNLFVNSCTFYKLNDLNVRKINNQNKNLL